ncbi:MAG: hypothetical protein K8I03_01410 [Ignavibacteria bacterium]|nr:hypothetical protein [Ignavibacteria bacterium]
MHNSNVISILRKFSQAEINEFTLFIRSPFYNKNQSIVKIYEYLKKQWPDFELTATGRKFIYKKIFESREYNDGFMRVLISKLTQLLEEYLTVINIRNRPLSQKIFLLNELNLRKLEKEFRAVIKKADVILSETPGNSMNYFYDKAMLEDNKYFFYNWSLGTKRKNKTPEEGSLKLIIDNFTRFYLIASLTMLRKVQYIKYYRKINIDLSFIEQILKTLESHPEEFSDTPLINLYTNEILLLTKGDRKYYNTLKLIFLKEAQKLSYPELYSLHNILQRYLAKQVITDKHDFKREQFVLYKNAVSKNIIVYPFKTYIEEYMFIAIVNSSLSANDIAWARSFIFSNEKFLLDNIKEIVTQICLAKIDFSEGNFAKSFSRLKNIKTKNPDTQLQIKVILLKIYFELSLFEEAVLAIDSTRHLLIKAEKSVPSVFTENYKGFLKFYSVLLKAKEKNRNNKLKEKLYILKKNNFIHEKAWLLEKTALLLSK